MRCPLPNNKIGDSTVVASCYYRDWTEHDEQYRGADDDWPATVYTVLLLLPHAPYFMIAHVADNDTIHTDNGKQLWKILGSDTAFNIFEALKLYEEYGGDGAEFYER